MARKSPSGRGTTARAALVTAVKSTLGFFVLLLLVAEATLGAAGLSARDPANQALALWSMLVVLAGLCAVVTLLAIRRPDVLMRGTGAVGVAEAERQAFLDQLYGVWAERVDGVGHSTAALSVVEIRPDPVAHSLSMTGIGFDESGEEAAFWKTTATGINVAERKVLYYWEGTPLPLPLPKLEGYAEITFYTFGAALEGRGWFSDANLADPGGKIVRKGVLLQKLGPDEARQWYEARDFASRASWVLRKLGAMRPARTAAAPATPVPLQA